MSRCSGSPATSRWTPSGSETVPAHLSKQVTTLPWASSVSELYDGLTQRPLLFLPLLLLIGALLWRRKALYQRLNKVHLDIGHFKRDSQWHTPQAILINILLAMPVSLGLALCGYALQIDARGQNAEPGFGPAAIARRGWCSTPPTASSAPGGVAELHFPLGKGPGRIPPRLGRRFGPGGAGAGGLVAIAERSTRRHWPTTCWASPWYSDLLRPDGLAARAPAAGTARPTKSLAVSPRSVGLVFTALPIALFIAVCFGYYYTALKLSDRLINTLYLLMFWLVIEAALRPRPRRCQPGAWLIPARLGQTPGRQRKR